MNKKLKSFLNTTTLKLPNSSFLIKTKTISPDRAG